MKKILVIMIVMSAFVSCTNTQHELMYSSKPSREGGIPEVPIQYICGESKDDCVVGDFEVPNGFAIVWSQMFQDGEDLYVSLLREEDQSSLDSGEWCMFKNDTELFCAEMDAGIDGPIVELKESPLGISVRHLVVSEDGEYYIKEVLILEL